MSVGHPTPCGCSYEPFVLDARTQTHVNEYTYNSLAPCAGSYSYPTMDQGCCFTLMLNINVDKPVTQFVTRRLRPCRQLQLCHPRPGRLQLPYVRPCCQGCA